MQINTKEKLARILIAFVMLFSQLLPAPVAYSFFGAFAIGDIPRSLEDADMELVAVVVDSALYNDDTKYIGLRGEYSSLKNVTFKERVNRYAKDLIENYPGTDVKIVEFDPATDDVLSVSRALENLYKLGDNGNKLVGTVLIGDIPLPVVNKNSNRFVSLYPYTDFVDKAYVYDSEQNSYIPNTKNLKAQAEIWHGIMRSSENSIRGLEELSVYLDKNHLYYLGEKKFRDFDKKMFFADLVEEEKNLNENTYQFYQKYLASLEDSAYERYTKDWAADAMSIDGADIDTNMFEGAPDIYTKQIIDQSLTAYFKLFSSYLSDVNAWTESTGRYQSTDVDTPMTQISVRDEIAKKYLKNLNDSIEAKINQVVDMIADDIPILEYSTITGKFGSGTAFKVKQDELAPFVTSQIFRFNYKNEITGDTFINGVNVDDLESPDQCSLYLGSGDNVVTASRVDNMTTAIPNVTTGVLANMISPEEAFERFAVESPGAVVEGFLNNPLVSNFENPFDGKLEKGDLIVSVNDVQLSASLNYENAIKKVFDDFNEIIRLINDGRSDEIDKNIIDKILIRPGDSLAAGNVKVGTANVPMEFVRDGVKKKTNFIFSVKSGLGSNQDPQGNPEFYLLYTRDGFSFVMDIFDKKLTKAAIFTQNLTIEGNGFAGNGYGLDAGCNANNTGENLDRCFARVAMMPIKDRAGTVKVDENFDKDVDELHLDACYFGMPGYSNLNVDANKYKYVLDSRTYSPFGTDEEYDHYGKYLNSIANFVKDSNSVRDISIASEISDEYLASDFVLNDIGKIVTLKYFSDRYGFFDGIDNDDDGQIDEFDEGDIKYGIAENDMEKIGRKMLSRERTFVLPASLNSTGTEITMKVMPKVIKKISSSIKHVEPTRETIVAHIKSMGGAMDLPIDNPRYVAFVDEEGETKKVNYVNAFESGNLSELKNNLKTLAANIALMQGAYKVFGAGANESDYEVLAIRDKIYSLFTESLIDAGMFEKTLEWNSLSIDDKHEYVLRDSLNVDEGGYELSYLVLDGNSEYFDLNFSRFESDVLDEVVNGSDVSLDAGNDSNVGTVGTVGADGGLDVVEVVDEKNKDLLDELGADLLDYYEKEIVPFINGFTTVPKFEDCCGYSLALKNDEENLATLSQISMSVDKDIVRANGQDIIEIVIEGDEDVSEKIILNVEGDENVYEMISNEQTVLMDKVAIFRIKSSDIAGSVKVFAVTEDGLRSNSIQIEFSQLESTLITYVGDELKNDLAADNESKMKVEVRIADKSSSQKVRLSGDGLEFEGGNLFTFNQGVVSTYIKPLTLAGTYTIRAEIFGGSYPIVEKEIFAVPGQVRKVDINTSSTVLVDNGESKADVLISVLDEFDNVVNNDFVEVELKSDEGLVFEKNKLSLLEGEESVKLAVYNNVNGISSGMISAKVLTLDGASEIYSSVKINIVDELKIKTSVNGQNNITAEITDKSGQRINYNGPVILRNLSENLGSLNQSTTLSMSSGQLKSGLVSFISNNTAGTVEIEVEVPGFASETLRFYIDAKEAESIKIVSDSDTIFTNQGDKTLITAKLFDQYANSVKNTNLIVDFKSDDNINIVKTGNATAEVSGMGKSGKVLITASADGLLNGSIEIDVKKRVFYDAVKKFSPKSLYISLLGENFGDISVKNNLVNALIFESEVQAIATVSAGAKDKGKIIAYVSENDEIEIISDTVGLVDENKIVYAGTEIANVNNGLKMIDSLGRFEVVPAYTGISSKDMNGYYLIDMESNLESNMSPGAGYNSLEDAGEASGIGFETGNKHMLYLSAGESVGQSHLPYGSEVVMIFGDPMIRLDANKASPMSGFDDSIGKSIYTSEKEILDMINFDVDNDGDNDIASLYADGEIRLLKNVDRNSEFEDMGVIANIPNGILAASEIDINNDGFDDLIVGTQDGCKIGDVCVTLLTNQNGSFVSETLDLNIDGKVYEIKSADLNLDGCEDIVLSDSAGKLRTFYNSKDCAGLDENYGKVWDFGLTLDSSKDISDSLYISYDGMPASSGGTIDTGATVLNHVRDIAALTYSTKKVTDLNGENINVGDRIDYVITLKNSSDNDLKNLVISDLTSPNMTIDESSLKCMDSACDEGLSFEKSGMSLRSHLVVGLNIAANSTKIIGYSMVVNAVPKVNFDIGKGFEDYQFKDDNYPDIFVKPEYNPSGMRTYLHSVDRIDEKGHTIYRLYEIPSSVDQGQVEAAPDIALTEEEQIEQMKKLMEELNIDSDYDGVPDYMDNSMGNDSGGSSTSFADDVISVASDIAKFASTYKCAGGGCLANPYNKAFFVPSVADGEVGTAVISVQPAPPLPLAPIPFVYGASQNLSSVFRFYISPTATLGLATAACFGTPNPLPSCIVYPVPLESLGLCPDFVGPINDAIVAAKDSLSSPEMGLTAVVNDGDIGSGSDVYSSNYSYVNDGFNFNSAGSVNIKIPGFPSIITDWIDNQTEEIFDKLLDLPDIYFIYPDFSTMFSDNLTRGADYTKISSLEDVLRAINSVPLIRIETKDIQIKVPAISQEEIVKYKRQAYLWLEYEKNELKKIQDFWQCDISDERKDLCDSVTVEMSDFIASVEDLLNKLDMIANLPRDILTWRTLEAKYASQLVCYLDAIMDYTGGYLNRQTRIIDSWMKAIDNVIKTFKNWKIILDIVADYQTSCDDCSNDRFTDIGLLLNIFAALPTELPVVKIPKWPDIVFDISQVRAGAKIIWPDVSFRPERIVLPDLPTITLPATLPEMIDINIVLEGFGELQLPSWLENFPSLTLPNALPDLPPLALPQLPDLPKPPKMPTLDSRIAKLAADLRPIFKILCLIKKGYMPVPEGSLANEIKILTAPSVSATLPFMLDLGVQMPGIEYDFVEEIRITAKLNFGIDTSVIYNVVNKSVNLYNKKIEGFIQDIVNETLDAPIQQVIDSTIKAGIDKANKAMLDAANAAVNAVEDDVTAAVDAVSEEVTSAVDNVTGNMAGLEASVIEFSNSINEFVAELENFESVDKYVLVAEQIYIDPSHPMLNRTIDEVELDILTEDLPDNPEMQKMANLRSELIAYTKNLNDGNKVLQSIDDYTEFSKFVAEDDEDLKLIASLSNDLGSGYESKEVSSSMFGSGVESIFDDMKDDILIAEVGDGIGAGSTNSAGATSMDSQMPKGFYVGVNGVSEKIMDYDLELDRRVNLIFNDVEGDSDTDIVFALGGDIYLKENYLVDDVSKQGDISIGANVSDYEIKAGVDMVSDVFVGNKRVDLSWVYKAEADGYKVVFRNSILNLDNIAYEFDLLLSDLSDEKNPSYNFEVENGNYYVEIYAVDGDNEIYFGSNLFAVSPSLCLDRDKPFPAVTNNSVELNIFETVVIDASSSFDSSGEIIEYYIKNKDTGKIMWSDKNLSLDEDMDGDKTNDKSNPVFNIGPYQSAQDIGEHVFVLTVVDQSGNTAEMEIRVVVGAPSMSLSVAFDGVGEARAFGEIDVDNGALPFSLMRKRMIEQSHDGELYKTVRVDKVITPSANADGKYYTDTNGNYEVTDFELDDMILVENADKVIVAEIHPDTGNVGKVVNGYFANVVVSQPGVSAGYIEIVDNVGRQYAKVFVVGDENTDVKIFEEISLEDNLKSGAGASAGGVESGDGALSAEFVDLFRAASVVVNDLYTNDNIKFESFAGDDKVYPGGVSFVDVENNKKLLIVDTAGNVVVLDEGVTLRKKANDHEVDPLIFEMLYGGRAAGEMVILNGVDDQSAMVLGEKYVPAARPEFPDASSLYNDFGSKKSDKFVDADNSLKSILDDLYKKDIIQYRETDEGIMFNDQEIIGRAEFVKSVLKMLCIIPRPEAYLEYRDGETNGGFSDLYYREDGLEWFYPYLKEADLRGLIYGYRGETDPYSELHPFKPNQIITRAEAVKVILEALEMQGLIDLSSVSIDPELWYREYMIVGQDMLPYLADGQSIPNNYIINEFEAQYPDQAMTRYDLIVMTTRVLDTYSCFEIDKNANGMSDYCEKKYDISDPFADEDKDGLKNIDECREGLDPWNPDTDGGGALDGKEVEFNTDPLNTNDDPKDTDNDGLTDKEEVLVFFTDPLDPDTDDGGIKDGPEVDVGTNPLLECDDFGKCDEEIISENESTAGLYIVPGDCGTCPCESTLLHRADLINGDILFSVISSMDEKYFFSKSNEVIINKKL